MRSEISRCPLCKRHVKDTLKHFSFVHNIRDTNQFKEEMNKVEEIERRRADFGKYVEQLKEQVAKGLISAEDYRRLIMEWDKHR